MSAKSFNRLGGYVGRDAFSAELKATVLDVEFLLRMRHHVLGDFAKNITNKLREPKGDRLQLIHARGVSIHLAQDEHFAKKLG